jgi:uncharacterized protein (TIGR03067 family)
MKELVMFNGWRFPSLLVLALGAYLDPCRPATHVEDLCTILLRYSWFSLDHEPVDPKPGADGRDSPAADLDRLQGEWHLESAARDGKDMPEAMRKTFRCTIVGDKFKVTRNGKVVEEGTLKLDPKKPRTIDFDLGEGHLALGIYEVNGDTYRQCYTRPGKERPSDFSTREGGGATLSVWKRLAARPSFANEPAPVRSGMALVSEPVLYFETAGEGPAVVLIHGGNLDRRMWDDQFQEFARHFQVIRYDVRTFGLSDLPTKPYSDVEDLASLLRFLRIKKAHLVGLSLGGRIIIDFALEHPDMVASLVPIGPGLSGFEWSHNDEQRFNEIARAAQHSQIGKVADLWLASGYMAPAMEKPALASRLRELTLDNARNWLANPVLARPIEPPATRRLNQIKAPTLLMVGSRDVPDIQKIVKTLKAGIPHAQQVVVQGAGHMVNMEKPEEFNRVVLGFLKERSGAATP